MEVEKIEDGPLKSSEISRFLEASKTAYKSVESVLNEKKETSFQQRTLLDIAAAAEIRNKKDPGVSALESEELVQKTAETEAQESEEKAKAEKIKAEQEAESLRIQEEQKLTEARLAQEEKEKNIYEKGFAEGKVALEREIKDKLDSSLLVLENARKSILDLNASHFIKLRESISSTIIKLASDRAGTQIAELPENFLKKIESFIESVGQITGSPTVYLNARDFESLKGFSPQISNNAGFRFKQKEGLLSGDIVIEIGSISATDTAAERSGIKIKEDISEQLTSENVSTSFQASEQITELENDIVHDPAEVPTPPELDPSINETEPNMSIKNEKTEVKSDEKK